MIPKELAKKIRYIQIYTSKAVNDSLAGEYESVFKGRGMEFDEVREYRSGDEIRSIDWNVTARMGAPFVKRFVEERELTVIFMVDLSASGAFGSVYKLKNEILAELCALLAFSAIKNTMVFPGKRIIDSLARIYLNISDFLGDITRYHGTSTVWRICSTRSSDVFSSASAS